MTRMIRIDALRCDTHGALGEECVSACRFRLADPSSEPEAHDCEHLCCNGAGPCPHAKPSEPERCRRLNCGKPESHLIHRMSGDHFSDCDACIDGTAHHRYQRPKDLSGDAPSTLSPAEVAHDLERWDVISSVAARDDLRRAAVVHLRQMEGAIAKIEWLGDMHRLNTDAFTRVVSERDRLYTVRDDLTRAIRNLTAERDAFAAHVKNTWAVRDEAIEQRDALAAKVDELRATGRASFSRAIELQDERDQLAANAAEQAKTIRHYQDQNNDLIAKLATSEESRRLADGANRELEREITDRKEQRQVSDRASVHLQEQLARLEAQRSMDRDAIAELRKRLADVEELTAPCVACIDGDHSNHRESRGGICPLSADPRRTRCNCAVQS